MSERGRRDKGVRGMAWHHTHINARNTKTLGDRGWQLGSQEDVSRAGARRRKRTELRMRERNRERGKEGERE